MNGTCNDSTEKRTRQLQGYNPNHNNSLLVQVKWPKVQEIEEMATRYEECSGAEDGSVGGG